MLYLTPLKIYMYTKCIYAEILASMNARCMTGLKANFCFSIKLLEVFALHHLLFSFITIK